MNLGNIKNSLTLAVGRGGLLMKKHSPEILMVTGVIGIVASTVMACRATLRVNEVLDEAKEKVDKVNQAKELPEEQYSAEDAQKDLLIIKVQTAVEFAKLYGPAILVGVAGIGCVLGAHGIMRKRNLALVAAYKAVEQSFKDYRKRVIDEFGEEKDRLLKNGIIQTKATVLEMDENGKTKKSVKVTETADPNGISQYARFFDESSINWSKSSEYNLMFLKCQQNYANDLLKSRGHVFLNEVYDLLGIPRSQAGAIVGWTKDVAFGDGFVDFGIFDGTSGVVRDFVNGYERSILLDFNVDGVVYNMI